VDSVSSSKGSMGNVAMGALTGPRNKTVAHDAHRHPHVDVTGGLARSYFHIPFLSVFLIFRSEESSCRIM
jgi:hypothetical protein